MSTANSAIRTAFGIVSIEPPRFQRADQDRAPTRVLTQKRRALGGTRKQYMESIAAATLLILDDFGMSKLPHTAPEALLEIVMRRYEPQSPAYPRNSRIR